LAAQGSPGSQGGTGSQGLQGPQGPIGINWIGDWIINVYDVRDAVYYNGSSYVCIASTVGTETLSPDTNTACWDIISLKGDVGPQGATGSPGVSGATGSTLQDIFYNIGGTVSATNSTTAIYRTGSLNIGTGTASDSRFVVSSSGGTTSLVVGENGGVSIGGALTSYALKVYGNAQVTSFFYTNVTEVSNAIIFDGVGYNGIKKNTGLDFFTYGTSSTIRFTNNNYGISSGETTMLVDTTKKYVGIGTASPSTTLHVYATQSGAFRLQDGTEQNDYILKSDSNGVASWTPLSSVGISGSASYIPKFTGTSSLGNSRFSDNGVNGFYGTTTQYVSFISGGNTWLTLTRSQSTMNFILGNPQTFQLGQIQSTNTVGLSIESAGYTSFNTGLTYTEKMRITSTGNVGIGLTAPSTTLHIYATQSGAFRLEDGTQGNGYILTSDANGVATWTASIYATDSNVVHKTGDESISGIKTFTNTGFLTSVVVQNYNTNPSSSALESINGNDGMGIKSENTSSGIGIYSNSTSTGLNYVGANNGVTTFSVNKTGAVSIGTGTASDSRFVVSSSGGTTSFYVSESGDSVFRGDTKIIGTTFPSNSSIPAGSILFGTKTSIYSPNDAEIVIGADRLLTYNYNYGWKFNRYQITNLWGNPIEVQNTMGTIGNLWIGSSYVFAGYGSPASQQSTLFVKGTTASIMKVVGTGATWSNSQSIFEINNSGVVSIGTSGASASLHIKGTSSVSGNSLLVENSSNTQLLKVLNNGQIILGDSNSAAAPASGVQGVFIIGPGNANYGLNSSNPNLLTFIVGSTNASFISGIQGASLNHGNVRSGIYFTNNASDIVFRAGYVDEYGTQTAQLQERMRIGVSGNVNINSATAMSGSKLFIQSSTSSTTIGSNVMLDLYNGDTGTFDSISEIAFSQNGQPGALSPYSVGHRYALITGYAITGNNAVSIGGIKFSTRETTGVSLVTSLVVDQNGSVYNTSRGSSNTIYGYQALLNGTASLNNTAIGYQALLTTTASLYNTAIGYQSLYSNTTGEANTAIGFQSLKLNTTGESNTAIGWNSLLSNTIGSYNTAIGLQSLVYNTAAVANTAIGYGSLFSNTTVVSTINITNGGSGYTMSSTFSNVQLSYISGSTATTYPIVTVYVGTGGTVSTVTLVTNGSGFKDTTTVMGANLGTGVTFSVSVSSLNSGDYNTAIGYGSLFSNTIGDNNVALGDFALYSNTTGAYNTAIGVESLYLNTTGGNNTALGYFAGHFMSGTTSGATNSSNSVFIGYDTRPQAASQSNQIVIGYGATGNGSNSVTLGNDDITRTYLKGSVVIADGTQGNGYILTSDTNGVASWTASFALGVIATSSNITTDTLDINGLSQRGRCIIIDNGTYSINLTVNGATGFSSTYLKHGTASVTFVQGSGRTLVQVDGTVVLNGVAGSTATLLSYGTTDYLRINNA
jgi:hypothetical protein